MSSSLRLSLLLLAGIGAAACGDDDNGPTGPSRADVAGIYAVCQLTFTPAGALSSVNLLDVAFETSNTQVDPPELRLDPGTAIQLAYTPRGAFVERTVSGTYDLSGTRATLRFTDAATRNALLLPPEMVVNFQDTPKQLSVASSTAYSVPRADYARLTGQSEANLAPQIQGQLAASFRVGSCS